MSLTLVQNPEKQDYKNFSDQSSELFMAAQREFNVQNYMRARDYLEQLSRIETGLGKTFIEALILLTGHFIFIQNRNWTQAKASIDQAYTQIQLSAKGSRYRTIDLEPILHALSYNLEILDHHTNELITELYEKDFLYPLIHDLF
ncbi:MAG: hypothetical protein AB7F43_10330 [Bacteriovoracia bacterium]